MRRTRMVAVAATLTAFATAVAPAAAAGSPTHDPGKAAAAEASNEAEATDGKAAEGKADNDITAAAAILGVSADDLLTAMMAAKTSLADSPDQTRDAFIAGVAANLGRPVAQVRDALAPMFVEHDPTPAVKAEPEGPSPLETDAAAAAFAGNLGIDATRAKAALAELLALSTRSGGLSVTSPAFADVAASLGISPQRLMAALSDLKAATAA